VSGRRRRAREIALQVLCALDVDPEVDPGVALARYFTHLLPDGEAFERDFDRAHAESLVWQATRRRTDLDGRLTAASKRWRLERMALVDRNVLRLALVEMTCHPDVPTAVAMDEAVELARRFGSEDSAAFVNGVLETARASLPARAG
jgi:N utilization substance protein B